MSNEGASIRAMCDREKGLLLKMATISRDRQIDGRRKNRSEKWRERWNGQGWEQMSIDGETHG